MAALFALVCLGTVPGEDEAFAAALTTLCTVGAIVTVLAAAGCLAVTRRGENSPPKAPVVLVVLLLGFGALAELVAIQMFLVTGSLWGAATGHALAVGAASYLLSFQPWAKKLFIGVVGLGVVGMGVVVVEHMSGVSTRAQTAVAEVPPRESPHDGEPARPGNIPEEPGPHEVATEPEPKLAGYFVFLARDASPVEVATALHGGTSGLDPANHRCAEYVATHQAPLPAGTRVGMRSAFDGQGLPAATYLRAQVSVPTEGQAKRLSEENPGSDATPNTDGYGPGPDDHWLIDLTGVFKGEPAVEQKIDALRAIGHEVSDFQTSPAFGYVFFGSCLEEAQANALINTLTWTKLSLKSARLQFAEPDL